MFRSRRLASFIDEADSESAAEDIFASAMITMVVTTTFLVLLNGSDSNQTMQQEVLDSLVVHESLVLRRADDVKIGSITLLEGQCGYCQSYDVYDSAKIHSYYGSIDLKSTTNGSICLRRQLKFLQTVSLCPSSSSSR